MRTSRARVRTYLALGGLLAGALSATGYGHHPRRIAPEVVRADRQPTRDYERVWTATIAAGCGYTSELLSVIDLGCMEL